MIYDNKTLLVKDNFVKRAEYTENSMVSWMYSITVRNSPTNEELRSKLGIKSDIQVMKTGILYWFGHAERKIKRTG